MYSIVVSGYLLGFIIIFLLRVLTRTPEKQSQVELKPADPEHLLWADKMRGKQQGRLSDLHTTTVTNMVQGAKGGVFACPWPLLVLHAEARSIFIIAVAAAA